MILIEVQATSIFDRRIANRQLRMLNSNNTKQRRSRRQSTLCCSSSAVRQARGMVRKMACLDSFSLLLLSDYMMKSEFRSRRSINQRGKVVPLDGGGVSGLPVLRAHHQIRNRIKMATSATMAIGTKTAKNETAVEVTSSAMLTGTLPAPPVVAVTVGRIATDLTACTLPATSNPQASAITGLRPVMTFVLAAKAMAPATGRTKVWIRSLM